MLPLTPTSNCSRSHQLRVHLQHAKHPILFDTLYGSRCDADGRERGLVKRTEDTADTVSDHTASHCVPSLRLHAFQLHFVHPVSGCEMVLTAPMVAPTARSYGALVRELSETAAAQLPPVQGQTGVHASIGACVESHFYSAVDGAKILDTAIGDAARQLLQYNVSSAGAEDDIATDSD